jgi:hypothetical protein
LGLQSNLQRKVSGGKTLQDIESLIPSFEHLDHEQAFEEVSNERWKTLKKIEKRLKSKCAELANFRGSRRVGQKEAKRLISLRQTLELKARRLLEVRNNHPLAVRIATIDDVLDPLSHFNNPEGRSNEARLLDAYHNKERSLEEKDYLNHELLSLIVWSSQRADCLRSRITEQSEINTPESRGRTKVFQSQLVVFERILGCAGQSLHPSQSLEEIQEIYYNTLLSVEVVDEDEDEDTSGIDIRGVFKRE